jgi:uncharacterized membrane protein (DUF441 family)
MSLLAILALGFFLGMRHATDADHVVAVATIVSRERRPLAAAALGALWGLGHSVTIVLFGGAIIAFELVIPERLGLSMEMGVAVMLVVLGALNLSGVLRRVHTLAHEHAHAGSAQPAPHVASPDTLASLRIVKPIAIGVVHGLAGSAAVALLVLTTIRDPELGFLYLLVFGSGTVLGMVLLTTAMTVPLAAAARRFGPIERNVAWATGMVSVALGLFLAYRIGFVDGLLTGAMHVTPK